VLCTDTTDVGRIFSGRLSYAKGAYVLHMLRWVCGDSAFFAGCRNYLSDPELAHGSALTPQLVAHLEASSGLDLTGFMSDWYVGEGYPIYQVNWSQNSADQVSLLMEQSTSHPSVDFFEMPVPVRFKNAQMDTTVVFDHAFDGQLFTVDLSFQADSALLDPDLWLLQGQSLVTLVPDAVLGATGATLFPNPPTEAVTVLLRSSPQGTAEVRVTDALGLTVRNERRAIMAGRLEVDVHDLAPGQYWVAVITAGTRTVLPFVKE
jgi:hypothetical protein